MQTLLKLKAEGESAFFWLLKARMPRCEPTSAAGLPFYLNTCHTRVEKSDEAFRKHILIF